MSHSQRNYNTKIVQSSRVPGLRYWRLRKALTQADLAQLTGLDMATISQIETGKRSPRPSTLRKLAKALDVKPAELFKDDE
jgi:transcriptional regulator with XRE-family HTH domain